MFSIGDTIMYDTWGVCRIVGTEEKDIGGNKALYFRLEPLFDDHTTLYLPQNNPAFLQKVRTVLSADEAETVWQSLPSLTTLPCINERQRRQQYHEIIAQGDRIELLRLIKTLLQRRQQRRLPVSDETAYQQAGFLLFRELAFVWHTTPKEVEQRITKGCTESVTQ